MATVTRRPRVTGKDREVTAQTKNRARGAAARATAERHRAAQQSTKLDRDREVTKRTELNIADRVNQNMARGDYAQRREAAREEYARNREANRILRVQEEARLRQQTRASQEAGRRNPLGNVKLPTGSSTEVTGGMFSDPATAHKTIAAAWVAGLSIITFQEIKANSQPPIPKYLVGWTITMGMLDLFAPIISYQVSSVFAIGFTIGLALFRKPSEHNLDTAGDIAAKDTAGNGPFKPGEQTSIGGGIGSGRWYLASDKGMYWEKFNTWTSALGANHPYPTSDPTHRLYVYDAAGDQWLLKSKLTGPLYDPSMAASPNLALGGN